MRLSYTAEELDFRSEVRAFLWDELPTELAAREGATSHLRRGDYAIWHQILARKGWAAPNWPTEYGGTGWSPAQRHIWEIEYGRACAPEISIIGISLAGPVICKFGSEDLKARYLAPILSGEYYFCQGFSEPQAGSDLANLRTHAVLDGEDYVINGQKIWTSHASEADFMICLCRTDPSAKPQAGLSMIIVPMHATGVTVRQIPSIDEQHSIFEVFLDQVRVPVSELIGEPDKAWTYAKYLLDHERTHNAYAGVLRRYLDRLRGMKIPSEAFRRRLSVLEIDVDALEWSVLRVLSETDGRAVSAAASALKVTASELLTRAGHMEIEALGVDSLIKDGSDPAAVSARLPGSEGKLAQLLYWHAASVFGGANEIQRGIIWNGLRP